MRTFVHVLVGVTLVLVTVGFGRSGARSAVAARSAAEIRLAQVPDPKDVAGPRANEITNSKSVPTIARGEPGTSWIALAVSSNGRVFLSDPSNSEEGARTAARNECEHTSGRTCSDTLSVPDFWTVVVLRCGTRNFLGGSAKGAAYTNALAKAIAQGFSADGCRQIVSR